MADEIINNEWKAREVKSAGAGKLKVISLRSNCGGIQNGIAFTFEGEGGWVVDLNDLKRIMAEAEALRPCHAEALSVESPLDA